jgi:hypothetical protein
MDKLDEEVISRLETERNIWIATVRADKRPHLVPIWFVYTAGNFYICIEPNSVKAKNMLVNPNAYLALENGSNPVICEGNASTLGHKHPENIVRLFLEKYEWNIDQEERYTDLFVIKPLKWLIW